MSGLPLVPDLIPGESLGSHIRRTQDLNALPAPLGITRHIAATGIEDEIAADAMLGRYSASVRGRGQYPTAVARTWRLPVSVRWRCPRCTPATGVWMRDWALACHPVCLGCGTLLAAGPDADSISVDSATLRWQRFVASILQGAVTRPSARSRVSTAYKVATLIALTLDQSWPPPASESDADLQSSVLAGDFHRAWYSRAATSPAHALVVARHAFVDGTARDRLITQGWKRLAERAEWADLADAPPRWLPALRSRALIPPSRRGPSNPSDADLRAVMRSAWADGLRGDHVPGFLLEPGERFLPRPGDVAIRRVLAVILHAGLTHRAPGRSEFFASAQMIQAPTALKSVVMQHLIDGRGLHGDYIALLDGAARELVLEGRIDRAQLRAQLDSRLLQSTGLTRALHRLAPGHEAEALGEWAWVDATGFLPRAMPPAGVQRLRRLDDSLEPEVRWSLRQAVVAEVEHVELGGLLNPASVEPEVRLWGVL